jgi:hypothetical protein
MVYLALLFLAMAVDRAQWGFDERRTTNDQRQATYREPSTAPVVGRSSLVVRR